MKWLQILLGVTVGMTQVVCLVNDMGWAVSLIEVAWSLLLSIRSRTK